MRLFVALHLETELREQVAAVQARLRELDRGRQVRWVEASGIHLTLQFLGEAPDARVGDLQSALAVAVAGHLQAPRLGLGRPGAFPNWRRPRVLWVGLQESGSALSPLHAAVGSALAPLGWAPEARAFQPHLTVGRVREEGAALDRRLVEFATAFEPPVRSPQPQPRLALVQSHLSPHGARYEDVAGWNLA